MSRYYVTAFGWWFCMARGWCHTPEVCIALSQRGAAVVKEEQPGVTVVEVSA